MRQDMLARQAETTIAKGSKSFAAAARLFRPSMRRDVMLLYAWCRHCDDVTDGQQFGHGRRVPADRDALDSLRRDSMAAVVGEPGAEFPYRALAEVCRRHAIDPGLIEDHLRGFALDVAGWKPRSLAETLEYCYCVAGTVGIMMARIMSVDDRETLKRACDLGLAFQLTNIARDVAEDARAGRCYLPMDWLEAERLSITDLHAPEYRGQVFDWVGALLETAEPYYDSATVGMYALPARAGWAIAAARAIYRDIGRAIIAGGPGMLAQRTTTGRPRKIWRLFTGGAQIATGAIAARPQRARDHLWTPTILG